MRGFEILVEPINDSIRGFNLLTVENIIIEVRDLDTNNIVSNATVTITGDPSIDGVYNNAGELNLLTESFGLSTTISATAGGYNTQQEIITPEGKDSYYRVTIFIESVQVEFTCEIETETIGGDSLNKNLSETENTVVKGIFTTIDSSVPPSNTYSCIFRQWDNNGSNDQGVVENITNEGVIIGDTITFSIELTPEQVVQGGERITVRIIEL